MLITALGIKDCHALITAECSKEYMHSTVQSSVNMDCNLLRSKLLNLHTIKPLEANIKFQILLRKTQLYYSNKKTTLIFGL